MRWRVGGVGVGVAVGWNIATLGPIATRLAHVYGVSLTTVGLFVTVQFFVHMVIEVSGTSESRGFFRDRRLYRLAAIHAMSFGFSVILGNWVVTLLEHHGHSKSSASIAGSLTLLLGFFTRAGGGALLRRRDASRWVAASLVLGGAA